MTLSLASAVHALAVHLPSVGLVVHRFMNGVSTLYVIVCQRFCMNKMRICTLVLSV